MEQRIRRELAKGTGIRAGHLFPEMKEMFEVFADRFVGIGMDEVHLARWRRYARHVVRFRQLLSQLSPSTAQNIAHANAEQLVSPPCRKP